MAGKNNEEKQGTGKFVSVRKEGGSVVITLGKRIPPDWKLVTLATEEETEDEVVIRFTKVA